MTINYFVPVCILILFFFVIFLGEQITGPSEQFEDCD